MISPADHERAVSAVRAVCVRSLAPAGRQYVFVEASVDERTRVDVTLSFYCLAAPRAELALLDALGADLVSAAVQCFDAQQQQDSQQQPRALQTVSFSGCDAKRADVSGCPSMAELTLPAGEVGRFAAAWSHDAPAASLFAPTMNECMSSWRHDVVLVGYSTDQPVYYAPRRPVAQALRPDIASLPPHGVVFERAGDARLVRRHGGALPFFNLRAPLPHPPPSSRDMAGISGARARDETRSRLVQCYDVLLLTIPVVCGCYVCDADAGYGFAHVPIAISERASRSQPVAFRDGARPGSLEIWVGGARTYEIADLGEREVFKGATWLRARRCKN